ncbi:MAG TPA: hypothetical protein VGP90_00875, partial [Acidimicrobiia bacterium]|nr:hypothetical protein [Acidimicrobiia bacterium]
ADHLAEAAAALASAGHGVTAAGAEARRRFESADRMAAEAEAVRRFGPADRLAAEVDAGWGSARARRAPAFAFLAGAGVLGAALAGIPAPPRGVTAASAGAALVAVVSTIAFLAFQLAAVAGGVALLRMLARRSSPILPAADRALVVRAARLCLAATAVAAGGFTVVVFEQSHRAGLGAGRAIAAAAGMGLILALSVAGLSRQLPTPEAGVGLVRSVPGPVTALVAVLAGCGAFSHAETGRAGSVLAGLVEAAAVVACVRLFGPALDLRRHPD